MGELAAAMGVPCVVDVALANAVRAQDPNMNPEEHYNVCCLLLTAIAVCMPRLAYTDLVAYRPSIQGAFLASFLDFVLVELKFSVSLCLL